MNTLKRGWLQAIRVKSVMGIILTSNGCYALFEDEGSCQFYKFSEMSLFVYSTTVDLYLCQPHTKADISRRIVVIQLFAKPVFLNSFYLGV